MSLGLTCVRMIHIFQKGWYTFFKRDGYSWEFYFSMLRLSWIQDDMEVIIAQRNLSDPLLRISKTEMMLILIRTLRILGYNPGTPATLIEKQCGFFGRAENNSLFFCQLAEMADRKRKWQEPREGNTLELASWKDPGKRQMLWVAVPTEFLELLTPGLTSVQSEDARVRTIPF